ncbi:MAG TPA: RagB/SusD family nutrient uptake outer membrane protein [Flavitalea sp.]|nr:RagB/SusD family nutrient uptake outer membrane protein [Flavitalea sp.]
MKSLSIFQKHKGLLAISTAFMILASCNVDAILDPNNPSADGIVQNASLGEIQNLVDGTESAMRDNLNNYFDGVNVIGREYYRFSTSDPRFTSDLLGKASAVLDNNTFYTTNPFAARYRAVKNTNILIDALTNTKASITSEQKKAGVGYAKTIQAQQLLMVLNEQYGNGIRVDVKDPANLGPFLSKDESLAAIVNLLNEANNDLKGNTALFPFTSTIYGNDGNTFSKFNRALAARVYVYQKNWAAANTALTESFYELIGDLNKGAYYLFSTAGGDQLNPLYYPLNSSGETRVAHPSFVTSAEAGDNRLSKVVQRASAEFQDGLSSNYDFFVFKTNADRIPIIRNEELILLYAEIQTQTNQLANAVTAINRIRSSAGLSPYGGAVTQAALITEILKQRWYSLYGEGHRWIDLRRYDRLSQLPIDRTGDDVWVEFPRPATE